MHRRGPRSLPVQRRRTRSCSSSTATARIAHRPRRALAEVLRAGDLVVANDAATLPASLCGRHVPSGAPIEVRLAGAPLARPGRRRAILGGRVRRGRLPRRAPKTGRCRPPLRAGDRLELGPLRRHASSACSGHPRLVELRFARRADAICEGLARHGRPIQYAHVGSAARAVGHLDADRGPPVAFEAPSAGFVARLARCSPRSARAASGSRRSPTRPASRRPATPRSTRGCRFDEPYRIPAATARRDRARRERAAGASSRVGTTVVRALEQRGRRRRLRAGRRASPTQRIGRHERACASSTRSSPARTSGAPAITSCCARSPTTRRSTRIDGELEARGYRRTSSATRCFWSERRDDGTRPNLKRSRRNSARPRSRLRQSRLAQPFEEIGYVRGDGCRPHRELGIEAASDGQGRSRLIASVGESGGRRETAVRYEGTDCRS